MTIQSVRRFIGQNWNTACVVRSVFKVRRYFDVGPETLNLFHCRKNCEKLVEGFQKCCPSYFSEGIIEEKRKKILNIVYENR